MGIEKNLAVKQFIKEIIYSKENILIRFDSAEIIDDDTALLGENSLRAGDLRFSAGNRSQALGGVDRINNISLKEVSEQLKLAPQKIFYKTVDVNIPNTILKITK